MADAGSGGAAAAGTAWVRVEERAGGGYAVVTLAREPVNIMDTALWRQLTAVLDAAEADPRVRGVVFQSGLRRDVFTAGNDLGELYAPNTSRERYRCARAPAAGGAVGGGAGRALPARPLTPSRAARFGWRATAS